MLSQSRLLVQRWQVCSNLDGLFTRKWQQYATQPCEEFLSVTVHSTAQRFLVICALATSSLLVLRALYTLSLTQKVELKGYISGRYKLIMIAKPTKMPLNLTLS